MLSYNLPFTLQDYVFFKRMESGKHSEVFLVKSHKFNTIYIAKVFTIPKDNNLFNVQSIDREVESLMKLNHPHVIKLYDHFLINDNYFIILEYCRNGSVLSEIQKSKMSVNKFLCYARQIIDALDFCHSNGIAHNDLKPENLLIDKYERIKLSGFNFYSGRVIDIEYRAPEIQNSLSFDSFKADIFSLGVIFCSMLNGCSPWTSDNPEIIQEKILAHDFFLEDSIPSEISDIISKMLVVNPNERITCHELKALSIFNETNIPKFAQLPLDALSPRGRRMPSPRSQDNEVKAEMMGRMRKKSHDSIGNLNQVPGGMRVRSRTNLAVSPRELKYLRVKKSKALTIYSLNIIGGINQPPRLKSRYPVHGVTFHKI